MSSSFGAEQFINELKSLFGDKQSREESQQFSTKPASDNLAIQESAGNQAQLFNLGLQKDAAAFGSGLQSGSYADKLGADYNDALQRRNWSKEDTRYQAEQNLLGIKTQGLVQRQNLGAQSAADLKKLQQEQVFNRGENAAQRASNERVAGMQAQAGMLSSLFGSVGSGSPNYRYWS